MLLFFCRWKSRKGAIMELINSVNIDALYALASKLIVLVGVMAFLVSVVTQVLKQIPGLEKRVPTQITVIVTSMILCPAAMAAMAVYYSVPIDWFMVFASFIASFIVSLVSMDGWEHVAELWNRMIKKS